MLQRSKDNIDDLKLNIEEFAKENFSSLNLIKYLTKENQRRRARMDITEERIIKIAASTQEMMNAGKIICTQEIKIPELEFRGIPVWYGDSGPTVELAIGNRDGDSSKGCTLKIGNSEITNNDAVHYMMGGQTGMGKSVLVNALIMGLVTQYAPWDVMLVMSDAKRVEFEAYAKLPLPHISAIAATGDVNYFVSILRFYKREMENRATVFGLAGSKKIAEFRKITGLKYPRIIIIMDEFTSQINMANTQQKKEIMGLIEDIGRKGRAAGVHMVLCSQDLDALDEKIAAQIQGRIILGCGSKVSNVMIGNTAGTSILKPGNAIANLNYGAEGGSIPYNQYHIVPYIGDEPFAEFRDGLAEFGYGIGYRQPYSMYTESDIIRESTYIEYISKEKGYKEKVLLGEPSAIGQDFASLEFNYMDARGGVIVVDDNDKEQKRFLKMLYYNFKGMNVQNLIYAGSRHYIEDLPMLSELSLIKTRKGLLPLMQSVNDSVFKEYLNLVLGRLLRINVDTKIYDYGTQYPNTELTNKLFELADENVKSLNGGTPLTELERNRVKGYCSYVLENPVYRPIFPVIMPDRKGIYDLNDEGMLQLLLGSTITLVNVTRVAKLDDKQIEGSGFSKMAIWILGCDEILGLGSKGVNDYETGFIRNMSKVVKEAVSANVYFILSTNKVDAIDTFVEKFKYGISSNPNQSQGLKSVFKNKKDELPEYKLSAVLGTLVTPKEVINFKKMMFDDETVTLE